MSAVTAANELSASGVSRPCSCGARTPGRPCAALLVCIALLLVLVPAVAAAAIIGRSADSVRNANLVGARRAVNDNLVCDVDDAHTFWIRNACHDGFVTVRRSSVMAQHQRVDKHDPKVAIRKETCHLAEGDSAPRLLVRLRHVDTGRYICFNRRGKIRALTQRRADRLSLLCAFYEVPVAASTDPKENSADPEALVSSSMHASYVQYRSAHRSSWLLGFNGRRVALNSAAHTRPRAMSSRSRARTPSTSTSRDQNKKQRRHRGRRRDRRRRQRPRRRRRGRRGADERRRGARRRRLLNKESSSWLRRHELLQTSSCDFSFATGSYEAREWRGLIHRILDKSKGDASKRT